MDGATAPPPYKELVRRREDARQNSKRTRRETAAVNERRAQTESNIDGVLNQAGVTSIGELLTEINRLKGVENQFNLLNPVMDNDNEASTRRGADALQQASASMLGQVRSNDPTPNSEL